MSTSSENVLLQVPSVRYKKGDGSLFLMDERLIWMVENRDTVAVSHPYADIKCKFGSRFSLCHFVTFLPCGAHICKCKAILLLVF